MKREKSCGALVIRKNGEQYDLVLLRHRFGGHWSFPKGHVEAGETERQTALREVKEETGLSIRLYDGFRESVEYFPQAGVKKQVVYFLGEALGDELIRQEEEISELIWTPLLEAAGLVTFANDKRLIRLAKRRLGLPEYIIEKAAARLDAENVRFEDVLTRLDQQRQEMERERAEARRLKLDMEQSAEKAREYRARLEAERAKVVEKANAEARAIIEEARAASDLALSELKELKKRQDLDWQQVNDGRAEARRLLNEAERSIGGSAPQVEPPPPTRPAKKGDTVELLSMGTRATVLSVSKDGTLQLQAGILKISAKQEEVRVVEGETQAQKEARRIISQAQHTLRTAAVPSQVDLRGMMTDEAIASLERFLDTAMMGKLETVTVIHGKGTGAVRSAVRTYLKRSRYVKSFRPGRYGEGEDGVTVVELK